MKGLIMKNNGILKLFLITVPIVLALVGYMVSNDQMSRTRDTRLQKEVTRVELQQSEQYGSIQTSLMRIETKLGIDE